MENSKVQKKKKKYTLQQDYRSRKFRIWAFLSLEILKGAYVGYKVILSRINNFGVKYYTYFCNTKQRNVRKR